MCLAQSSIRNLALWNWDGGRICEEPVVSSGRPAVGTKTFYNIDVREFLVTERNAVMHSVIENDIATFIEKRHGRLHDFRSRKEHSFDYRASVLADWVSQNIGYGKRGQNYWQFPDETLRIGRGLCEDRALLLASLLIASGVSSFNVRVALGKIVLVKPGKKKKRSFDHMWVMYKNEAGLWRVLEPQSKVIQPLPGTEIPKGFSPARKSAPYYSEYVPEFLFNDVHLWEVKPDSGEIKDRVATQKRKWRRLHPRFIGSVHESIITKALSGYLASKGRSDLFEQLDSHFFHVALVLDIVEDVDYHTSTYDPRQHFDNGYIKEGWKFVADNLEDFRETGNLDSFAHAAHAIADFYSHSSYGHFAKVTNGAIDPFDPSDSEGQYDFPQYDATEGFDLTNGQFSINKSIWTKGVGTVISNQWRGQIISGRYAQSSDTQPGLVNHLFEEGVTNIPKTMTDDPAFYVRGSLPHHNEIAVDHDPSKEGPQHNQLYVESDYAKQFERRSGAAVLHIRKAFQDNWDPQKTPKAP